MKKLFSLYIKGTFKFNLFYFPNFFLFITHSYAHNILEQGDPSESEVFSLFVASNTFELCDCGQVT